MKKSIIYAVVVFLLTATTVYAQQIMAPPQEAQEFSLRADGDTLRLRTSGNGVSLSVNVAGKLNGKSIEFKQEGFINISMNNGKLTDEEIQLAGSAIEIMKSALKRDKFEAPGISFKLKGEGKILQADVKSGAATFEGNLEGTINGNPFEFKSDSGGEIVVNNGMLTDIEIKMIESGFNIIKNAMGRGKSPS